VDQSASHRWLEQFYSARRQESLSLPQACRAASLQLKREGLHAYFWAPFVVNGALGG
jgi:CHAT domain-containing protein